MRLSLHDSPGCPDCVRQAKRTAQLDWLRAIELRAERSPLGEVPVREIVVGDKQGRRVFTGIYATRMVCLRLPLLFLYGLLLYCAPIRSGLGERSPGATVMRARSDAPSLAIVTGVHVVIGRVHQYAHAVAEGKNSSLQALLIVLVVTVAPWAAIRVAWTRDLTIGAVGFSVAMLASLVFGLVLHFPVEGADLYLNVAPEHRTLFRHSAMGLTLEELAGVLLGAHVAIRSRHPA